MTSIVIHADCLQHDGIPDATCCITDPPFSQHVHTSGRSGKPFDGVSDARVLPFASLTPQDVSYLAAVSRTLPGWTVLFSDIECVGMWSERLDGYMRAIPWVRFSQPQKTGDRPGSGCEMIVTAHRSTPRVWNGPGNLTHFAEPCMRGDDKHPSQKPLDLCLSLVSYFSQPGDIVFDPYAGHATIGLACRLIGRDYIGLEREALWHTRAQERLDAPLSARDRQRVSDWIDAHAGEYHPEPKRREEEPAYARYVRRIEDVKTVKSYIEESEKTQ